MSDTRNFKRNCC